MKTFLKLLLLAVMVAYLFAAFAWIVGGRDTTKCTGVNVVITDSVHAGFITSDEVLRLLNEAGLNPTGRIMDSISGQAIEDTLLRNSFIRMANCYKTPGGTVYIQVAQRLPILRVKANNGEDYYIDSEGVPMRPQNYTANLAIATGSISKDFAHRYLVHLARYLHNHKFANDLITQINVEEDGRIELIPRIGCEVIRIGRIDSVAITRQMGNLYAFYTKVLPTVGWTTYREVSLEFANQIICKKA